MTQSDKKRKVAEIMTGLDVKNQEYALTILSVLKFAQESAKQQPQNKDTA